MNYRRLCGYEEGIEDELEAGCKIVLGFGFNSLTTKVYYANFPKALPLKEDTHSFPIAHQ